MTVAVIMIMIVIAIATAMGLHRDPGPRMDRELAERRRWAWWHVVLHERCVARVPRLPARACSHASSPRFYRST